MTTIDIKSIIEKTKDSVVQISEEDKAELLALASDSASEDQVKMFIAKQVEIRIKHYKKECKMGDIKDSAEEQAQMVHMQNLIGELWTFIVTTCTKTSAERKVPANYLLNAMLHASAESAVMMIESYKKAAQEQGLKVDTNQLVQDYAMSLGGAIVTVAHNHKLL